MEKCSITDIHNRRRRISRFSVECSAAGSIDFSSLTEILITYKKVFLYVYYMCIHYTCVCTLLSKHYEIST